MLLNEDDLLLNEARVARATPDFDEALRGAGTSNLARREVTTLQINVGKLCNQACNHCHVEAGPKRTEVMTRETAARIVELLDASPAVTTLDITGGAPELNPNFRDLVAHARATGREVIDRCNLTVIFEPGMDDLPAFLAEHRVNVTASLPCYSAKNVDAQRGLGVFDKSTEALRVLNELGYGQRGSGLELNLVYNPGGAFLPPPQQSLEASYKQHLRDSFGIEFSNLYTITNMPISRFAHSLHRDGKYVEYMELLVNSFNPQTIDGLMCTELISIGWDGQLYDCDFNQMLEIGAPAARTIWDIDSCADVSATTIATANHCFGCTAGAGSSCGGALD